MADLELNYITLDFETAPTFLTGIRGDTIVGNFVIPGTSATGGLLYDTTTGTWSPFPVATPDMTNFPGATTSSPYGPSFGSVGGILRVVGSYQTSASPFDLGYLYDGAAAPGEELLTLVYPDPATMFTIAHSTFGNLVVGNYDTGPLTGNAFIYDIAAGAYTTNNMPGAASTTAYGVWGDKIAGGHGELGPDGEPGFEHGYIYDMTTDSWTSYDHPEAVFTHFEGITGAGRGGEYNLVADWIDPLGNLHAAVLHIDADGNETWIPIEVPGAITTSANSIHQDRVIGVYTDATGTHGFVVVIPGIYNPIRNVGVLHTDIAGAPAISAGVGDDVVNEGTVGTSGADSSGIRSDSYGVVYNYGSVAVSGPGSAAVEMQGLYGALLNGGTLRAAAGADAIRADGTAFGSLVVNTGIIDGRVDFRAGPQGRFENSGWLGVLEAGAGTEHVIAGTFAQTSAGALGIRVLGDSHDSLTVDGSARLAGTLAAAFQPGDLTRSYTILTASIERTGVFETLATVGLPSFVDASLDYTDTDVVLALETEIAEVAGLTGNERAVGGALDRAFNTGGGIPDGLNAALFGLPERRLPAALNALSGEIYASERSVLINDALFGREALLGRLRQKAYGGAFGPERALAMAGPPLKAAPVATADRDLTVWLQGVGAWNERDGDADTSDVTATYGAIFGGADVSVGDNGVAGFAAGYARSNAEIDALASSATVDTGFIAGYAGASFGAVKLRAGGAHGFNFVETDRTIRFPGYAETVTADVDAGTSQLFGEVGYGVEVRNFALEPFAGLAWVHLDTDDFRESGGAAALTGSAGTSDVGSSTLGVRAAASYVLAGGAVVTPHVSAAWQHAFGDLTPSAALGFAGTTGANFTVTGVPLARDAALIDAGIDLAVSPNATFGLSYLGQIAGGDSNNAVRGNLTWTF